GLHLNVAEGKPVSPGLRRLVTTDGHFFGKPAVFGLLAESGAELAAEIATELTAQALRLQALGVAVDHLDGHRHGHIFPAVLPHALALAQRWGIPWFRLPEEEPPASPVDIPEDLRREAALFQRLAAAARPVVTAFARRGGCKGLRITDAFRGLYLRGCLAEGSLGEIIAGLPEGVTELMVHPGFRTSEKREGPFTAFSSPERERELAALLSPSFRAALTEGGVQLVPFPP
ncbi:MAG: ChbG/HpnK family deacetylase, partial [Syntrophales bacterium]|nr:ChbG/HpnK family deacetylase [Syntrophales bacterium]